MLNARTRMKILSAIAALAAVAMAPVSSGIAFTPQTSDRRATLVRDNFVGELANFERATAALVTAVGRPATTAAARSQLRKAFTDARLAYKRVEFFVEYYAPLTAMQLNGPPIDEVELEGSKPIIIHPQGFQVLEALLFPAYPAANRAKALTEARGIHDVVPYLRGLAPTIPLRDAHIFDALRLEVARVTLLGLVGYDSPMLKASQPEATAAIDGIRAALKPYQQDLTRSNGGAAKTIDSLLTAANAMIAGTSFDEFDRLAFITTVANPLARTLNAARSSLRIALPTEARFWRVSVPTVFDVNAFDVEAIKAPGMPDPARGAVALGERLFSDPAMSGASGRSCASCHDPKRAFVDGLPTSPSLIHGRRLRNAPTLFNAALQRAQFADMRAPYLEDQVQAVVSNEAEMSGTLESTAFRLSRNPEYARLFAAAFPQLHDTSITPATIRTALAEYVRSLNRLNSRADRAMRGDVSALDAEERQGFNLFTGKAACATCHFLPLTNGTLPPVFERTEQEVLGVPSAPVWRRATVDPDTGRIVVTHTPQHRFAFKVPTVRNASVTAPYMHNGVYKTLDDVVRFYDGGGGAGIGIRLPNQTLPPDSLHLTPAEKKALVRFMEALADTTQRE